MGNYKRILCFFSIVLSLFLFNIDVFADGQLNLSESKVTDNFSSWSYSIGSQTGTITTKKSYQTDSWWATHDGIDTDSSIFLYPSFVTFTFSSNIFENVEYVYFNVMTRNSQLSGVTTNNGTANCTVNTAYSFDSQSDSFIVYSVECKNVKFYSPYQPKFTFHLNANEVGDRVQVYIKERWGLGTYSNETNDLLEDANEKQQQIIDKTTETNTKLDENKEAVDKQTDTIKDSDTTEATDSATGFFNDFEDTDYGFSDIIKMPLQFINNLSSASCSPLVIPLPFVDNDVTLPCMYSIYQQYFGDFLSIYQTITFGIVAYWVCINLFAMVKGFKDPQDDKVEVFEL